MRSRGGHEAGGMAGEGELDEQFWAASGANHHQFGADGGDHDDLGGMGDFGSYFLPL
jgi:hypothetical protein